MNIGHQVETGLNWVIAMGRSDDKGYEL